VIIEQERNDGGLRQSQIEMNSAKQVSAVRGARWRNGADFLQISSVGGSAPEKRPDSIRAGGEELGFEKEQGLKVFWRPFRTPF
jgi:hypothetical protein